MAHHKFSILTKEQTLRALFTQILQAFGIKKSHTTPYHPQGEWVVKTIKSPVNVEITDGKRTKVVHTNRLQHRYIPGVVSSADYGHKIFNALL